MTTSRRTVLRQAGAGLGAVALAACGAGSDDSGNDGQASAGSGQDDEQGSAGASEASGRSTTTAPDLEPSGYLWTGARVLFVTVPVASVEVGTPWLPPGLEVAEPATATFFIARYPLTAFRSVYNEAAVLLHVTDANGPARHCSWMVVDDDTALIYGRELLGFPKKMADIELTEADDGGVVGVVSRHGEEVLRLEADLGAFEEEDGRVWSADRMVNAHGSVIGGMNLLEIPPLPEEVHSRSVGTATVSVGSTDRDPLGELEPAGEGDALWAVVDFAELSAVPTVGEEIPGDWAYSMSIFSPRVQ